MPIYFHPVTLDCLETVLNIIPVQRYAPAEAAPSTALLSEVAFAVAVAVAAAPDPPAEGICWPRFFKQASYVLVNSQYSSGRPHTVKFRDWRAVSIHGRVRSTLFLYSHGHAYTNHSNP